MNVSHAMQLPSVSEMLEMIKRPVEKNSSGKFDNVMLSVLVGLFLLIGALVVVAKLGWMEMSTAQTTVLVLYVGFLACYVAWMIYFILSAVRQLRRGYKVASEETERRVLHELNVLDTLSRYPTARLKECGRLVELESKRWTRRGGVGAAFAAAFGVGLNLVNVSIQMEALFPRSETIINASAFFTMLVYAVAFSILLAAAMIYVFASHLEKLAGLLSLAAERVKRD